MLSHPATDLFPLLDGADLQELVESIKEHGLIDPIVCIDDLILDGRNRFAACQIAGVEPRFTEWKPDGLGPTEWVIAVNLRRRHLTVSQRAAIAVEALPALEREAHERMVQGQAITDPEARGPQGRAPQSRDQAAKQLNVSAQSVTRAKRIKTQNPETFEQVKDGSLTISEGLAAVGKPREPWKPKRSTTKKGDYHAQAMRSIEALDRLKDKWTEEACAGLSPKQAQKQLRTIEAAAAFLEQVRVAVEYRSATLHTYLGH